ncbi:MAG: uracil-DNA glycosylase family protein [Bacteroidales bacterium]
MTTELEIETHPLEPFLPENAKLLMMGSFPPPKNRWKMEFYYPNYQNDMWRMMGLLFFDDKNKFVQLSERKFDYDKITAFCTERGIALFDTASAVRRLKDNASDQFLEVVEQTDVERLLSRLPHCKAMATTGQKAAETVGNLLQCDVPSIGTFSHVEVNNRKLLFYRMPSSSRAYPLPLEKKADIYRIMFRQLEIL